MLASVTGLTGLGPQPAEARRQAVYGLEQVFAESAFNSSAVKEAIAVCPAGKQVLGGGGRIIHSPEAWKKVTLNALVPRRLGSGYAYTARAAEIYSGTSGSWSVRAIAFCVNPVRGYNIITGVTPYSSSATKAIAAVCPNDQSALGSGAMINSYFTYNSQGNQIVYDQGIGLQVAQASSSGLSTRAKAHEAPEGYPYSWQLVALAVCADTPLTYRLITESSQGASEDVKAITTDECPKSNTGYRMVRVGMSAPGNVTLTQIFPLDITPGITGITGRTFYQVQAVAVENTPISSSWNIVAQSICVSGTSLNWAPF